MSEGNKSCEKSKETEVVIAIMEKLGITKFEEDSVEAAFKYKMRYMQNMLMKAKVYATHAGRLDSIELEDMKMALADTLPKVCSKTIAAKAAVINDIPLKPITQSFGLRIPKVEKTNKSYKCIASKNVSSD